MQEVVRDPLPYRCEGTARDLIHKGGDTMRALLCNKPGHLDVTLCIAGESGSVNQPNARVSERLHRRSRRPGERRDHAEEIARAGIADRVLASRTSAGDENAHKAFNHESD